jgi:GntR family transcriptional regulator, transcriptional repressor for pyruvate dehydrogenase complex
MKRAVLIAQQIVRDVIQAGLKPGDWLPSEKIMAEQYATGRGTLREALRLLEFQGVIALKPGPGGGPVLLEADSSHLSSTIILLMELKASPFQTIVEARVALEPMISSLAATHMDEDSLLELKQTIDQMTLNLENEHTFLEANKRFHDIIAWSSGNSLFGYLVDSLLGIMDGSVVGVGYPLYRREAILQAHEDIYDAILSRDAAEAERRMREHIDAYVTYVNRKFPEVMEQVIRWS